MFARFCCYARSSHTVSSVVYIALGIFAVERGVATNEGTHLPCSQGPNTQFSPIHPPLAFDFDINRFVSQGGLSRIALRGPVVVNATHIFVRCSSNLTIIVPPSHAMPVLAPMQAMSRVYKAKKQKDSSRAKRKGKGSGRGSTVPERKKEWEMSDDEEEGKRTIRTFVYVQ